MTDGTLPCVAVREAGGLCLSRSTIPHHFRHPHSFRHRNCGAVCRSDSDPEFLIDSCVPKRLGMILRELPSPII